MKRVILILVLIYNVFISAYAGKIEGYYIDLHANKIDVVFRTKILLFTSHLDYTKIAGGINYYVDKKKKFLSPDSCSEIGLNIWGREIILKSVPNNFQHILKVYTHNVIMCPRIIGATNLFYFSYNATVYNGSTVSSVPSLGWLVQNKEHRILKITYGSANKKDLLDFFYDCDELIRKIETKELHKNEIIEIIEFYNAWYESQHPDAIKSVSYNEEEDYYEEDNMYEP